MLQSATDVYHTMDIALIRIAQPAQSSFYYKPICSRSLSHCPLLAGADQPPICTPNLKHVFYRAMLCMRGTSHGPVSVSVCLCLSQIGVLLKRLNVGSQKQNHTIGQDSSFLVPRISAKFDRGHPLQGHQIQAGWVKIGDF